MFEPNDFVDLSSNPVVGLFSRLSSTSTINIFSQSSQSSSCWACLSTITPYASVVRSIMYAMVATRPDLAYVVGVVSWYMSTPGRKHWEAVKHIFRCLRGTKDAQLTFGSAKLTEVEGYIDSDYVGNTDNLKSTPGYLFTYGGSAISWRSKLQECTTLSTTKVEYIEYMKGIWENKQKYANSVYLAKKEKYRRFF